MNLDVLLELQQHLQVVHHVPGRIRIKFDIALANHPRAREFFNGSPLPGIKNYRMNAAARSIVVEYDKNRIAPDLVQELFSSQDTKHLQTIVDQLVESA